MTQEEKAKRYDEAISIAREFDFSLTGVCAGDVIQDIFPELKESDDGGIKKELILFLKGMSFTTIERAEQVRNWIAWLEKQGEHSIYNVPSREVILAIWELGNEWKELTGGSISTEHGTQLDYIQKHWHESEYYLKEKQGEQKSIDNLTQQEAMDIAVAKCFDEQKSDDLRTTGYWRVEDIEQNYSVNKVEPKFHEGEWITNGDYTWKIVEIKPLDYILQSQDGNIVDDTISHVDEQFHSFTIEDARDGDVLALNDKTIVIFKDLYSSTTFHAYCYVKEGTFSVSQDDIPDWWNSEGFYPATKEQRDLLFQKMKEAGYVWDAEKKELKKIEDEEYNGEDYGIDSLYHAQRILKKTLGKVDGYQSDDGILEHKCAISAVKKLYEQKPWSEEDEKTLNEIFSVAARASLRKSTLFGKSYDYIKWQNWLKSLRDRYTWKPSDEQIYSLDRALRFYGKGTAVYDSVKELLEQLKKLKG